MKSIANVIERQVAAYNAQEVGPCVDCFAENAILEREADGWKLQGRQALTEFYDGLFKRNPKNRARILTRLVAGSHVVDEELIEGRQEEPACRTIIIYRVENGVIQHARVLSKEPASV